MSHALCHPFVSFHHTQPSYPCFIFSFMLCAPLVHSFSDSSPDVSLFILFFADSFVPMTHFYSDLLTNCSHVPYPLCFLIFSFMGRCSPTWVNNRVDTSSHASLLMYLSKVWLAEYLPSFVISGSPLPFCTSVLTV